MSEYADEEWGGKDPFSTTTGFLDDVDVEVLDAHFEIDAGTFEGNDYERLVLVWNCKTDDEDTPEVDFKFTCGADWRTDDDGKTAIKSPLKPFHQSSHLGKVLIEAASIGENQEVIAELRKHGKPNEAAMWIGTQWHMVLKEFNYGKEVGKREKLVPNAFYGYAGGGSNGATKATGATKAVAKKAAGVTKKAVAKKEAAPASNGKRDELVAGWKAALGDEAFEDLTSMAQAASDINVFLETALSAYEGIEDTVADDGSESFYEVMKVPF